MDTVTINLRFSLQYFLVKFSSPSHAITAPDDIHLGQKNVQLNPICVGGSIQPPASKNKKFNQFGGPEASKNYPLVTKWVVNHPYIIFHSQNMGYQPRGTLKLMTSQGKILLFQKVDIDLINTSAKFGNVNIHSLDFMEAGLNQHSPSPPPQS